jgi:hypothetical protein
MTLYELIIASPDVFAVERHAPRAKYRTPMVVTRGALVLTALAFAPAVLATPTFTVDSTLDQIDDDTSDGVCHTAANTCTLRAATMQANKITGVGVTIVVPSGTYILTRPISGADGDDNGDLNLTTPIAGSSPVINIVGAGAASTIIDANQIDHVLSVGRSRTATISGVTIRNGYSVGAYAGGISNLGKLTITDSVIESNQTSGFNAAGGGIYSNGTLTVLRSTIRSNSAYLGGGIYQNGIATIRESSIYGNNAGFGGGIEANHPSQLIIVNSTISQNYANNDGGGIDSDGNTFLYNTSVIGNDADHAGMTGGTGGGVYAASVSRFLVVNTLIAGNTINNAPISDDCNGTLEGYGWNLLGDLSGCTFTGNGDASRGLVSLNSIGPLQDNGGPTLTYALLPGSEAIDSTYPQGCIDETGATLSTDQRGAPRVEGLRCDVGAFEYGAMVDRIFKNGFE